MIDWLGIDWYVLLTPLLLLPVLLFGFVGCSLDTSGTGPSAPEAGPLLPITVIIAPPLAIDLAWGPDVGAAAASLRVRYEVLDHKTGATHARAGTSGGIPFIFDVDGAAPAADVAGSIRVFVVGAGLVADGTATCRCEVVPRDPGGPTVPLSKAGAFTRPPGLPAPAFRLRYAAGTRTFELEPA